jgi:hypothetical protein
VLVALAGTGHSAPKLNASSSAAKIDLYMIFLSLYRCSWDFSVSRLKETLLAAGTKGIFA